VKKKLLRVAVSVFLVGFLAWKMRGQWDQIVDTFVKMRVTYWLLAVGVFLVAQVASSVRWRWLARPLGFTQGPGQFLGMYFVGMFFNVVLPTSVGGDVVRAWYLDGHSGRRLPAFVSVFADRVSGLLVLLTLACLGVLLCGLDLDPLVRWGVLGSAGGALLGMAAFGLLVLWKRESIKAWGEGRRKETWEKDGANWSGRFVAKLRRFTLSFSHTLTLYACHPRMVVVTTLLSLIVQAANVLMVALIGTALGAPIPASYYWILVPVVSLLTVIVPSIGAVGVRETGTMLLLVPLAVDQNIALSVGFSWTIAQVTANLTGIFFYLFGRFERFAAVREEVSDEADPFERTDGSRVETATLAADREVRRNDRSIGDSADQRRARESAAIT
jgi:glycosyltransferase 2 family protein